MIRNIPKNQFSLHDLLMKNFFDSGGDYFSVGDNLQHQHMPADILLSDAGLTLELSCIGADLPDIDILRYSDYIRIKYTKSPSTDSTSQYLSKSIRRESFDIGYKISGKYDLEKMTANLGRGILTIRIPLKEQSEAVSKVQISQE